MSNKKRWTTRDGRKIRIIDMDNEHLVNAIKLMDRVLADKKLHAIYPSFGADTMAQDCAEREYESLMDSEPGDHWPIYNDMIEEASRRGIYVK